MASGEEWQVVPRRKGVARKGKPAQSLEPEGSESSDSLWGKRKITEAMNELKGEHFCLEWRELLSSSLADCGTSSSEGQVDRERECLLDCVCYGLGNFSFCVAARYQLAMLLLLLDTLQIPVGQCSIYDPVFTVSEWETLRELGFTVLTENEEGKRAVCHPTVFYLIHCGKALYNNLLWKNWNPQILPDIIVIGNSFLGIRERYENISLYKLPSILSCIEDMYPIHKLWMLQRELERDYSFLSDIIGVCEETNLPCSPRFLDVFNDTSLIRFRPDTLSELPESIWVEALEPQYQHCLDLEIIQKKQELKEENRVC